MASDKATQAAILSGDRRIRNAVVERMVDAQANQSFGAELTPRQGHAGMTVDFETNCAGNRLFAPTVQPACEVFVYRADMSICI